MDEDMRVFQNQTIKIFRDNYNQPALAKLDIFLDRLVHFMESHAPLLCEAQDQGILQIDETAQQASPQMWQPWLRSTIGMLLQQAEQNGEARDLDIPYLVDAILAPLDARLFLYQREELAVDYANWF